MEHVIHDKRVLSTHYRSLQQFDDLIPTDFTSRSSAQFQQFSPQRKLAVIDKSIPAIQSIEGVVDGMAMDALDEANQIPHGSSSGDMSLQQQQQQQTQEPITQPNIAENSPTLQTLMQWV